MESTSFWIVPETIYALQLFPESVNTYEEPFKCVLSPLCTNPLFFNWASALRIVGSPLSLHLGKGMRPSSSAAKISNLSKRLGCVDMLLSSFMMKIRLWGEHPIAAILDEGYIADMSPILLILILLLLFGGGGFYLGGPVFGGGGLGLILLICLVIYFMGGFRTNS